MKYEYGTDSTLRSISYKLPQSQCMDGSNSHGADISYKTYFVYVDKDECIYTKIPDSHRLVT